MLQKSNSNKCAYYKPGDVISFSATTDRNQKIIGEIVGFEDSVIVFKGFHIHINEISCLYLDEKTRWWIRFKPAQLLLIAGAGYLLVDAANSGEFKKETLILSGVTIGTGLLLKVFIRNRITIKGRTRLRILRL